MSGHPQGVEHMPLQTPRRIKVHIRCRHCGESFILRGSRKRSGEIDTGFKRCLCDNDRDFDIETID
ncbi:hypothetical protein CVV65_07615 [Kyrpidia spormannii]|uniref:Uncharacterized protein n=1 Tax=Kyrpidia spormannii TaxID=2055160 RepID=A0A2K8N8N0_9BACL|nr:hypothetical protein CVV65_07615 [Kyrpidia spormannii]HHY68005.1 hypothetical protein [Alicyclobacillus sp.]